jgi:hypothetical protein
MQLLTLIFLLIFLCCQFILSSCLWTVIYLPMSGPYCVITLRILWYNDYQSCYTFVRSPVRIKAGGHSLSVIMHRFERGFDFWHLVIIIMFFQPNLNNLCNWYTLKSMKSVSSWLWVYFCMAWQCEQNDKTLLEFCIFIFWTLCAHIVC